MYYSSLITQENVATDVADVERDAHGGIAVLNREPAMLGIDVLNGADDLLIADGQSTEVQTMVRVELNLLINLDHTLFSFSNINGG
jgi:hypothetical protein